MWPVLEALAVAALAAALLGFLRLVYRPAENTKNHDDF